MPLCRCWGIKFAEWSVVSLSYVACCIWCFIRSTLPLRLSWTHRDCEGFLHIVATSQTSATLQAEACAWTDAWILLHLGQAGFLSYGGVIWLVEHTRRQKFFPKGAWRVGHGRILFEDHYYFLWRWSRIMNWMQFVHFAWYFFSLIVEIEASTPLQYFLRQLIVLEGPDLTSWRCARVASITDWSSGGSYACCGFYRTLIWSRIWISLTEAWISYLLWS